MILWLKELLGLLTFMIYSVREIVSFKILRTAFRPAPMEFVPSIAITVLTV